MIRTAATAAAGAVLGLASMAFVAPAHADPAGTADLAVRVATGTVPAGTEASIVFAVTDNGPDPALDMAISAAVTPRNGTTVRIDHFRGAGEERCTATGAGSAGCFRDRLAAGGTLGPADLFELHLRTPADATGPVATVHVQASEEITDPDHGNDSTDVTITAGAAPSASGAAPSASASSGPAPSASPSTILVVPVGSPAGSPPAASDELPSTGADLAPYLAAGGGLLLAGAALLFAGRRGS